MDSNPRDDLHRLRDPYTEIARVKRSRNAIQALFHSSARVFVYLLAVLRLQHRDPPSGARWVLPSKRAEGCRRYAMSAVPMGVPQHAQLGSHRTLRDAAASKARTGRLGTRTSSIFANEDVGDP